MSQTSNLYEVVVTTDIIRGSHNHGDSSSHKFDDRSDMIGFVQELFKGKKPFFVSGMAVHESPQITTTACVYVNHRIVDASSFIS